jgi:hypothetical protein
MAILMRSKTSVYGLDADLTQLQTNITNEANRATAEEVRIEGKLDQEVLDRTAGDSNLRADLNTEIGDRVAGDNQLRTDLQAEETRAIGEEQRIEGLLNGEVARATQAETDLADDLADEVTRATNEEGLIRQELANEVTLLNQAVTTEQNARIAEDISLDARLDTIEAGLVAGVVPMGSFDALSDLDSLVEADLQHGWSYYINDDNDLMLYVTEGASFDYQPTGFTYGFIKYADYTELSGLVNAEENRAIAAEGVLRADLSNEVTRATGIEGVLRTDVDANTSAINNEVTRATAAEGQLTSDLSAEVARATAAEGVLQGNIGTESTRATNEEARIDAAKLAKASNLSDLVDVSVARTNLDVYSKSEIASAITSGGATPISEVVTVTSGKVVLTYAPKSGVSGIVNFSTVRYTDSNGVSYDAPLVATANSKEFNVSTDTAGQWDGYSVLVQYLYSL